MEKSNTTSENFKDFLNGVTLEGQLEIPNFDKLKNDRQKRNNTFMKQIECSARNLEKRFLDDSLHVSAAVNIQRVFRGYLGRKKYLDILYEDVKASEVKFYTNQQQQVKEGEILVDNYRIQRELEDNDLVYRSRSRLAHTSASIIQRAWRSHKKSTAIQEHMCCECNEDFPNLYNYYSETRTICFCCEKHRTLTNEERAALSTYRNENMILIPDYPSVDWARISSLLNKNKLNDLEEVTNSEPRNLSERVQNNNKHKNNNRSDSELSNNNSSDSNNNNNDRHINNHANENYDSVKDLKYLRGMCSTSTKQEKVDTSCSSSVFDSSNLKMNRNEKNNKLHCKRLLREDQYNQKSIMELREMVVQLEKDIACKNMDLLRELMIRDELFSSHEVLLQDAELVTKQAQ